MTSVLTLMGLMISAPDHSTVSRRAETLSVIQPASVPPGPLHVLIDSTGLQVYGAGQWLEAKHGAKSRRTWRKLHLAVDAANGMIVAETLTDQDADDPSQVGPLLDQIDEPDWPGDSRRCVRRLIHLPDNCGAQRQHRGGDPAALGGCPQRRTVSADTA
jgi:hypothetical protein